MFIDADDNSFIPEYDHNFCWLYKKFKIGSLANMHYFVYCPKYLKDIAQNWKHWLRHLTFVDFLSQVWHSVNRKIHLLTEILMSQNYTNNNIVALQAVFFFLTIIDNNIAAWNLGRYCVWWHLVFINMFYDLELHPKHGFRNCVHSFMISSLSMSFCTVLL